MSDTSIDDGFAADWLALREPFDAAARNRDLALRFATALGDGPIKKLIDLGAGTGANFRYLAPLIDGDQQWLLIDNDSLLLSAQIDAIAQWAVESGWHHEADAHGIAVFTDNGCWRARGQSLDLAVALETLDLCDIDGVTTTAFLDLVSASWLDRLVAWLADSHCPLLATLTVDGRRIWQLALDNDVLIDRAFHRHQISDKGFGVALGNTATHYLAERLRESGYAPSIAHSDWQIDAKHSDMLNRMASEAADVAAIINPSHTDAIAEWLEHRHAQIAAGNAALTIGHRDLLGVIR